jgi:hypothetical protein
MTIQPNSAAETAAQTTLQAFARQKRSVPSAVPNEPSASQSFNSSSIDEMSSGEELDPVKADQLTQNLTQGMTGAQSSAFTAQSGINAQTALELLQ